LSSLRASFYNIQLGIKLLEFHFFVKIVLTVVSAFESFGFAKTSAEGINFVQTVNVLAFF